MKSWDEIMIAAEPFVKFLINGDFFATQYGGAIDGLVIIDPEEAINYATNDSFDDFEEWETASDAPEVFSSSFKWSQRIDRQLLKENYWGIETANFNGADKKLTANGVCILKELMIRDVRNIMHCYANDDFPKIWKNILDVYLDNGFPCGWSELKPRGKIVIFSNARKD